MFTHITKPGSCILYCLKKSKGLLYAALSTLLIFSGLFTYAGKANAVPTSSTLSVVANNAVANGIAVNTVKVKVTDLSNVPLAGQTVVFTVASGTATIVGSGTVSTIANGEAQVSLKSLVAGNVTVTATVNGGVLTSGDPTAVDFVAGAPATSNPLTQIIILTNNAAADGVATNTVKVHVVDANGNPVTNQAVNFSVSIGGSGGSVSYVVTTDANGDAILPLSSTSVGDVSVTAKVNGATIPNGSPAVLHFVAGPPDASNPDTKIYLITNYSIANGVATDVVAVIVVDANGNPVPNATVVFTQVSGAGTFITSSTVTTDANGKASVKMTSTVAGTNVITATVNGSPITNGSPAYARFIADVPSVTNAATTLSVPVNNATADGTATDKINAHIADANGNPVAGASVVFTQTDGSGTITSTTTVVTNSSGDASVTMTSTVAGSNHVTATVNGTSIMNGSPADAKFVAGSPSVTNSLTNISVPVNSQKANGSDADKIKVHVVDANGNPVANATVVFTKTSGSGAFVGSTTVTTDANGDAFISMNSTVAGDNNITATVNGATITNGSPASAKFVADVPAVSNPATAISVAQNNAKADGTATDKIKVHVVDANGNPVAGATVVFTQASGSGSFTGSTTMTTDANGDAIISMTSTVAGPNTITATVDGTPIVNGSPATATFVADVPAVSNPATVISVSQNNAVANGTATDQIKAHVVDANGNPVAGATIVFTKTSGSGTFAGTTTVITDANGDAVISMTSNTVGSNTITATVNGTPIVNGSPADAKFVADVPAVSNPATAISVAQDNAKADGAATDKIKVHVVDANGNPVAGATIIFTQTSGSAVFVGSTTITTDANGDAIISMTSTVAGANTITATVNGTPIVNGSPATATFVADVPAVSNPATTISVPQNNAKADGAATDQIKVHVVDANGNPVAGATVVFTKASGSGTFVGTTTVTTDANGDALISMTSNAVGANTITATVNGTAIVNGSPATATFVSDAPSVTNPATAISVTQDNAIANTTGTDKIKVHVVDVNGNPVAGAIVVFTKASGSATFVGSTTITTDANGDAIISMTSTVVGTNTITATVNGTAVINGSPATATFVADVPAVTAPGTKITVDKNDALADGTDADKVTVHVTDANGNPVAGATVVFAKTGDGTFAGSTTVTTDANGEASITLTSTVAGVTNVTATVNGKAVVNGSPAKANFKSGTVDPTNPNTTITIEKDNAFADGKDADTIKVHAVDANGNPVVGQPVVFTQKDQDGNIVTTTVNTDANGDAILSVVSNKDGKVEVIATVDGTPLNNNNPTIITFKPAIDFANPLTAITVVKDSARADNIATNSVKVHLVDTKGNVVANAPVEFTIANGTATIVASTDPLVTDANGDVFILLISGTPNTVSITAKAANTSVTNGSPANIHFMPLTTDIIVPKIFTPNNDGRNDVLYPIAIGIREMHVFNIYNRWGNLLFSSKDATTGWDGTLRGTPQPVETYLWFAEGVDVDGKVIQRKGMVTLAR